MAISVTLPVDSSGNKTKVILQFFALDNSGEIMNGSALIRYVNAVDGTDLPLTGTVQERKVKQEAEMSLQPTLQRYINPPSLAYVTADVVGAKTVGKYISERKGTQLTGVPSDQDLKEHTNGVFSKLIEVLQANGALPV